MAEKSMYWYTNGFTGATGDGSAPYTQEEQRGHEAALFGSGVIAGVDNELAVSGTASPLAVDAGRAQVGGFHYWNSDEKELTVTTPSVGTTGGRVVLRADWSTATTRMAILSSADGVAAIPALTQLIGVTYEISLASFTITTGGVITLTDTREFVNPADGHDFWREGNGATDWYTPGATYSEHVSSKMLMQFGANGTNSSGVGTVTFPTPFDNVPIVLISMQTGATGNNAFAITAVSETGFTVDVDENDAKVYHWLAVGLRP